jgi:hypothetical protein
LSQKKAVGQLPGSLYRIVPKRNLGATNAPKEYHILPPFAMPSPEDPAISQSHMRRKVNGLIWVRVAVFPGGLEDLHEKKGL